MESTFEVFTQDSFGEPEMDKKYFLPQYKADKCAKYLLYHTNVVFFDLWMYFLTATKFKKMFGAK